MTRMIIINNLGKVTSYVDPSENDWLEIEAQARRNTVLKDWQFSRKFNSLEEQFKLALKKEKK